MASFLNLDLYYDLKFQSAIFLNVQNSSATTSFLADQISSMNSFISASM